MMLCRNPSWHARIIETTSNTSPSTYLHPHPRNINAPKMKYTIHHVLIATVIVAAPTIATVRPIDATVITDFSTIATSSFEAICAVKRDDNDIFERSIADQVRLFTGSMKYMLTGTTLDSVVQHKYLEIVAPAKPVEDEQSFELLKKRAVRCP